MTRENKERVRNELKKGNWVVVDGVLGEEVSALYWGKNVRIIYEDMDGQPQICVANYDYNKKRFIGVSDWVKGNFMCAVIAYEEKIVE